MWGSRCPGSEQGRLRGSGRQSSLVLPGASSTPSRTSVPGSSAHRPGCCQLQHFPPPPLLQRGLLQEPVFYLLRAQLPDEKSCHGRCRLPHQPRHIAGVQRIGGVGREAPPPPAQHVHRTQSRRQVMPCVLGTCYSSVPQASPNCLLPRLPDPASLRAPRALPTSLLSLGPCPETPALDTGAEPGHRRWTQAPSGAAGAGN